jgi:putative ABC transport system permease protein
MNTNTIKIMDMNQIKTQPMRSLKLKWQPMDFGGINMNFLSLSWAYLRAEPLNMFLNLLLLTLGMGTIVVLLLFNQQLEDRLSSDSQGIDLVVGAKGSSLQLVLSSIYHADTPIGNIPLSEVKELIQHQMVKTAIPLALGDNYQGYRIVGTTSAYPLHYKATLDKGRFWEIPLEVILGAEVAQDTGLEVGTQFFGRDGFTPTGQINDNYKYTITGLLKPTGTVIDRLILTNLETSWKIHQAHYNSEYPNEKVIEQTNKELTALLIQYKSPLANLSQQINNKGTLQAVSPADETTRLLKLIGFGIDTLRAFGILLITTATLGMFITLYHALKERRYDLAIMRTLGASKARLLFQLLFEGIVMAMIGTLLGILLGHVVTEMLGQWLSQAQQLHITGWTYVKQEYTLIGLALLIGSLSALFPAIQAFRTDIAKTLSHR